MPASYTLKVPAKFAQYFLQVVETVGWLEKSKLPSNDSRRRQANTFLIKWMTGFITVSIPVSEHLGDLYQKGPDLFLAFMGGWARYAIQHPGVKDLVAFTADLQTMPTTYQAKGGKGNKKLNELAKLNAAGQPPTWVQAHAKA